MGPFLDLLSRVPGVLWALGFGERLRIGRLVLGVSSGVMGHFRSWPPFGPWLAAGPVVWVTWVCPW